MWPLNGKLRLVNLISMREGFIELFTYKKLQVVFPHRNLKNNLHFHHPPPKKKKTCLLYKQSPTISRDGLDSNPFLLVVQTDQASSVFDPKDWSLKDAWRNIQTCDAKNAVLGGVQNVDASPYQQKKHKVHPLCSNPFCKWVLGA